jgi:nitrate reductase NapE component
VEKQHIESPIHYSIRTQPNQPSLCDNLLQPDISDSDKYFFCSADSMRERQKHHQEHTGAPKDNKDETMRWVFLVFLMFWLLAVIVVSPIVFCLTRNPLCFSPFATLAQPLYRITGYLFPKSKEEYSLQALRIQHGIEKKRVCI